MRYGARQQELPHYKPVIAFLAGTHYGQKWQQWPKGRKGLRQL
jgi:hypothetical protein